MDSIHILSALFKEYFGFNAETVVQLDQAGSDRRYWRLSTYGRSAIGTFGPDRAENECFIHLSGTFEYDGAPTPKIYAVAPDRMHYLQEDLGDRSLFAELGSDHLEEYLRDTIRNLVKLQTIPRTDWIYHCQAKPFSVRQVMWDLNYFKYEYVKPSQVVMDEDRLEDDFEALASRLSDMEDEFMGFMMRDCQSRNVMLTAEGPKFIDYQGGRLGPVLYDAVSLLWQSRADFPSSLRKEMLDFYADEYCGEDIDRKCRMLSHSGDMILFRTLQVLGAYGFRGLVQNRAHFVMSIPGALRNLRELLNEGSLDPYPELKNICIQLAGDVRFVSTADTLKSRKPLTVEIYSFSYKKGYPADYSGNGGGFMFDCRAMHNPGRYAEYKSLTGRDAPVIDFLEERGEVRNFLCAAWSLTDPAVERYISRGFSKLQIGFGCTGGQHRSVYCAERTAEHVRELFPEANVMLIHREHPAN